MEKEGNRKRGSKVGKKKKNEKKKREAEASSSFSPLSASSMSLERNANLGNVMQSHFVISFFFFLDAALASEHLRDDSFATYSSPFRVPLLSFLFYLRLLCSLTETRKKNWLAVFLCAFFFFKGALTILTLSLVLLFIVFFFLEFSSFF